MSQTSETEPEAVESSPAILFACMIGARRTGDFLTAGIMRRELERRHDIVIKFGEKAPGGPRDGR
jgi:hypothetical protein